LLASRTYATPHVIGALIGRTFDRAEISASREFPFPLRFNFNGSCLPFAICKRILDCRCARCRFVVNENGDRRRIFPHASRKKIRSSKKNFRTGRVTTSPPPVQLSASWTSARRSSFDRSTFCRNYCVTSAAHRSLDLSIDRFVKIAVDPHLGFPSLLLTLISLALFSRKKRFRSSLS